MQSVGRRAGRGCQAPSRPGAPEPVWRQSCPLLVSLRCLPVAAQMYTTHSSHLKLHLYAAYESCHGHSIAQHERTAAVCTQNLVSSL